MIRRLEKCCGIVYMLLELISFRIKFHYACILQLYYIFRIKCYRSHMRHVLLLSIICGKKETKHFFGARYYGFSGSSHFLLFYAALM
jgi:hypothetical protein